MTFIISNFNDFIALMKTFSFADFLDVSIMSYIIYNIIKLIRETRASQLVKGIIVLLIVYVLSKRFDFKLLVYLLNYLFQFGFIALLIVFQPELRRALEQMGRSKIGNYLINKNTISTNLANYTQSINCIQTVVNAAFLLSKTKTGALIIFERQTKLGDIINTGTILNAKLSIPLIGNIFFNKAPLHDGAMIIRNNMICAAGCILPLTKNENINPNLGTRHRAALGISENSDAIALIVSEENGMISIAKNGKLTRNYTKESLVKFLENNLLNNKRKKSMRFIINSIMRKNK